MRPDINELRDIRNSYYKNNVYEKNRRNNNRERVRNYRNFNDNSSASSNDDFDTNENINSNYYNRNYYNRNYNPPRRNNGLFKKIKKSLNKIFNKDENVIYAIIAINIIVHLLWETAHYNKEMNYNSKLLNFMHAHFTVSWTNLAKRKRYWTLLTSVFSHEDILHLVANMVSFYSFSLPVIRCIGKEKFIKSYLFSGISSSFSHILFYHHIVPKLNGNIHRSYFIYDLFFSRYVNNTYDNISSLGASGAIIGINTIFACLYPSRLIMYNNYLRLPAWLTMSLYIFGDLYRSLTLTNGQIDTIGHVGG
eukprot:jgi/Orpsp1_1/1188174/evm.model.d7180000062983.1